MSYYDPILGAFGKARGSVSQRLMTFLNPKKIASTEIASVCYTNACSLETIKLRSNFRFRKNGFRY